MGTWPEGGESVWHWRWLATLLALSQSGVIRQSAFPLIAHLYGSAHSLLLSQSAANMPIPNSPRFHIHIPLNMIKLQSTDNQNVNRKC